MPIRLEQITCCGSLLFGSSKCLHFLSLDLLADLYSGGLLYKDKKKNVISYKDLCYTCMLHMVYAIQT